MVLIRTYLQILVLASVQSSITSSNDGQLLNLVKSTYCEETQGEWFHRQERLSEFCHFNVALFGSNVSTFAMF
jgi:hypothetical protein